MRTTRGLGGALGLSLLAAAAAGCGGEGSGSGGGPTGPVIPAVVGTFGTASTFATHAQLAGYGYSYGPSDGQFGAIRGNAGTYTFYGSAGSGTACAGTPSLTGEYTFTGTLTQVTGSSCTRLFGPGSGPAGWVFDSNYAAGGPVVRFAVGADSGWFIPFHAEIHWVNPSTSDGLCYVNGTSGGEVPCFYGGLGLAVSTDGGVTFRVVGQVFQPSEALSVFKGGGTNMSVGYGSLLVADSSGKHLPNPPADPSSAYFYLFFTDRLAAAPGACTGRSCVGVERARYDAVVAAALSGDPHQVATAFRKYDGTSWTAPATSDTPGDTGTAGAYAPLFTDETGALPEVMYDSAVGAYLLVYQSNGGIAVRASSDLVHWSGSIATAYSEPGRQLYFPTLMGETGDPTIGGPQPRVYFTSFPTDSFPKYATSVFESVPLSVSKGP
ncbi:MAG TPA: hypothetical protein VMF70_13545 [Gemmatimonadales bacterium]|nr:hypothetical protein [Gemmatimonadales bacterium]